MIEVCYNRGRKTLCFIRGGLIMHRRILVAYDGSLLSRNAIQEAKWQARQEPKSEVHIISVIKAAGPSTNVEISRNISNDLVEKFRPQMEMIKNEFEREKIPVIVDILINEDNDNPGVHICKYAENNEIDLIIIGSRGLGNIKKLFLGSVSNNVVQNAKSRVLVVK